MPQPDDVTAMLASASVGDKAALDRLVQVVYEELRRIAAVQLRRERPNHTIGATALVNEAYVRLVGQQQAWNDRNHFFAVAATCMRRILTSHARKRLSQKRGGGAIIQTFDEALVSDSRDENLVAVDEALTRLSEINQRQSKVVEYRFYVGLKHEEIAQVLGVSTETVRRDWRFARAWLSRELTTAEEAKS